MRKISFLILAMQLQAAFAQNFNPYYNFKHINVENGLAQDVVYHFLQDSRGYMWLGTRKGVTVFDGIRTITFQHDDDIKNSLGGNFITRIVEDGDHQIWIGNNAGLDLFNPRENNFSHYSLPMADGSLENTYCVPLGLANKYDLWFIDTKSKLIRVFNTQSKKFRLSFPTDAVDGALYTDSLTGSIHVWSYLSNGSTHLVMKNDSLTLKQHFFSKENPLGNESLLIYHVLFENDTLAWLSTAKGLVALNPLTNQYKVYSNNGVEKIIEARYAMRSPGGLLWVSTGYGVYTFDSKKREYVDHFMNDRLDPYSLCSNNIVSLYFDRVGNLWCGSFGSGVSYAYVENNFFTKSLPKNELDHWKKGNNVLWLDADLDGNIWTILQDVHGFWLLDSNLRVKEYREPLLPDGKKFLGSVYELLFDSKTTAWCLTDRGLFHYHIPSNTLQQVDYPKLSDKLFGSYWLNVMLRLHDGSFLFTTMGGIYRIRMVHGKQTIEPFSDLNKLSFISFDAVYEDNENNIYVQNNSDSLYMLSLSNAGSTYHLKKGVALDGGILQFEEDDSNLYLVTSSGILNVRKKDLAIGRSALNSMVPNSILNGILINKNKTWLFTDKGLYYYDGEEKSGRLFTTEDGLPSNRFSEACILKTSNGKFFAGSNNGILSFYPDRLIDKIYPPRAQLINIYINDSTKGFVPNPQEISKIVLDYNQNTFTIDFSCISFQHAALSNYEYRLNGFDDKWIRTGTTHDTRYSKVPPGNYNFQLRIVDAKGNVSPFMKTLDIEIKKAFWQTNIFRILMGVLIVLGIWLLIKWYLNARIRKQQREFEKQQAIEKERTRIATDMHDDLGAGLSRIKFLSETIGLKKQLQQPIEEEITSISNYADEMIGKMGEIVWALNEKNDSLSDLLSYTRAYAVDYLMQNGIECQVNAPDTFPAIFLSGEFRQNMYLSIKEALHNIIKHAQAYKVIITIMIGSHLVVMIHDDGVGFDPAKIRPFSNGLNNMNKRMKEINGKLEIIHKRGTTIILSVPLPA